MKREHDKRKSNNHISNEGKDMIITSLNRSKQTIIRW